MIGRYTLPEMGALWTDDAKFGVWLEIEVAAAQAMAKLKIIPASAARTITSKAGYNTKRVLAIEREVNHDVIAFLTSVAEHVGPDARYLHFGLTSSDVLDTALSVQLMRAAAILDKKVALALKEIRALAQKHKKTPCIGRTHGVLAEPTTLGLKFAVWYTELSRGRQRLKAATERIAVGKLSGAVGNFANVDPRVEEMVCKKLGLRPAEVSTQVVQRDRHAEFVATLAILASSLEKFATEIRNLQRTEIGEMSEGFGKKQKGSSAMPHKKNPITAERISGIARLVRGYSLAAMENIPLWHERDIAHSSVERVILPDATIITDYSLQKFIDLLQGLDINERRMRENIFYGGGLVFSQQVLLKLAGPVGSREQAYRMVQRHAMAAHEGRGLFRDLLSADPEIRKHLSVRQIDDCFDLAYYTKRVDAIFRRVFKR